MTNPSTPTNVSPLRVFISYSSPDRASARMLYSKLRDDRFNPWLDKEDLLPGQNWQLEIRKAVRKSDVVLICLSKDSTTRAGYVNREIKYALDVADEQPEGRIFLIPVRLEECDVPERLREWQWVDVFESDGYDQLLRALRAREGGNSSPISPSPSSPKRTSMPTPDLIVQQQELLAAHRRTLMLLLRQQALRTMADTPPHILHSIVEARDEIRKIKKTLRDWEVPVEDEPNDEGTNGVELGSITSVTSRHNPYRPPSPERIDLAIVTAMHEELEPILDLVGGPDAWTEFLLDKFVHYRGTFAVGDQTLNVVACSLWNYGGNPTTAALLRLKPLRPRIIAMTGICAGWDAKGVHLGDVVVADRGFRTREGKATADGFEADTQTYQPPPWLMQWLRNFASDKQWFRTIEAPRPQSLRYQAEWLLCRLVERNGVAYPQSQGDWDEISASEIDVEQSWELLLQRGLIAENGTLTEAGQRLIVVLRQKHRGMLQPTADPEHPSVHYGAFASSEAIIARSDPFEEHAKHMRKVRAIELEVASLFAAAAEIEVPAFAVKGVSDYGTPDKDDAFHVYAAEAAARWMYAFVHRYAAALLNATS